MSSQLVYPGLGYDVAVKSSRARFGRSVRDFIEEGDE